MNSTRKQAGAEAKAPPGESGISCVDYSSYEAFRTAIGSHGVWLAMPGDPWFKLPTDIKVERLCIHRFGSARCLTVSDPGPSDFENLGKVSPAAFFRPGNDPQLQVDATVAARLLAKSGCKLFHPYGTEGAARNGVDRGASISGIEFLVSRAERLASFPSAENATSTAGRPGGVRAVFMLELIQDIEILKPLILRGAIPGGPLNVSVSVSDRILSSIHATWTTQFLESLSIPWFTPGSPYEIAAALGSQRALLITASESDASGHQFVHHAVRTAPPRTTSVTLQHGYECVGLRHHTAHNNQFKRGVRFASDLVLTWQSADQLPNLHPLEAHKVIPVGVCKGFAEASTLMHEQLWFNEGYAGLGHRSGLPGGNRLLVAENLHSVRFSTVLSRYQRFLRFILDAQASVEIDLTVRSHPGKRTLEKVKKKNRLTFLEGTPTPLDFARFDFFVSPPSTIVLDAALAGLTPFVWSDETQMGDVRNYRGLEKVTDIADVKDLIQQVPTREAQVRALRWAAENTCAFNGVAQAWQVLRNLAA